MRRFHPTRRGRRGTTLVEMAVVLPVFFLFLFALMEFSHAYMVVSMLNAATKRAARYGVADGVSTTSVEQKVKDILAPSMTTADVTVQVKNAGVFDEAGVNPSSIDYGSLQAIDLTTAASRQLFVVRAEVRYEDVALIPPFWIKNATLSAQSVMRHE
jgi:Flp pilus assembly protein TadG